MAYDGRLLRLAQERYEADRSAREADLAEQREQLYARRPRLREIQDQLRRTASRVMAAALRRGEDPLPEIQRLREENLSLQAERQMLLAELGLPDNALEDTPLCPFCNDTGYRGGEMCRCLKTYYVEEQRKELSKLLDLGSQSFDTFDTDWYSDQRAPGKTKSAREHMEWVYDTCVEYAHNFGKKPANLLLFGRPGLGKTHLSAAIAREVSGKGFSVVYDTAGHIFERFEAQKFGRDEAERDVERVLNCDLLILDDLGTEMVTTFVQSALYQIINGRLLEKKSTIVSTNLMPEAIAQRYPGQQGVGVLKAVDLALLLIKGAHHAHAGQILAGQAQHPIQPGLHGLVQRSGDHHHAEHHHAEQRDGDHKDHRRPGVDRKGHDHGAQHHKGAAQEQAQKQVEPALHLIDIAGHAGDEGGRGEAVDVREGELLYLIKEALAQVGAEALAGKGGVFGGEHAEGHGQQGEGQHDRSQPEDIGRIPGGDGDVHDLCHDQWQDQFADDLQGDKDRGAHCLPLIALEMGDE